MWRILRIRPYPEGPIAPDCGTDTTAVEVTLKSDADGAVSSIGYCMDTRVGNQPCGLCNDMRAAGYTPGDWDTECPPD